MEVPDRLEGFFGHRGTSKKLCKAFIVSAWVTSLGMIVRSGRSDH